MIKKDVFLINIFKGLLCHHHTRTDIADDEPLARTRERKKWDQDDDICRGHILNAMFNTLFDAFHNVPTAKEL